MDISSGIIPSCDMARKLAMIYSVGIRDIRILWGPIRCKYVWHSCVSTWTCRNVSTEYFVPMYCEHRRLYLECLRRFGTRKKKRGKGKKVPCCILHRGRLESGPDSRDTRSMLQDIQRTELFVRCTITTYGYDMIVVLARQQVDHTHIGS